MARICFYADDGELHEVRVGPDHLRVLIGRHSACDVITRGQSVSRRHAVVTFSNGTYTLQDLGSSNGTFFERHRLPSRSEVTLEDGSLFMCGSFELRLDYEEEDFSGAWSALPSDPPSDLPPAPMDVPPPPKDIPAPPMDIPAPPMDMAPLSEDIPAPSMDMAPPSEDIPAPPMDMAPPSEDIPAPPMDMAPPSEAIPAPPMEMAPPSEAIPAPSMEFPSPSEDTPAPPSDSPIVQEVEESAEQEDPFDVPTPAEGVDLSRLSHGVQKEGAETSGHLELSVDGAQGEVAAPAEKVPDSQEQAPWEEASPAPIPWSMDSSTVDVGEGRDLKTGGGVPGAAAPQMIDDQAVSDLGAELAVLRDEAVVLREELSRRQEREQILEGELREANSVAQDLQSLREELDVAQRAQATAEAAKSDALQAQSEAEQERDAARDLKERVELVRDATELELAEMRDAVEVAKREAMEEKARVELARDAMELELAEMRDAVEAVKREATVDPELVAKSDRDAQRLSELEELLEEAKAGRRNAESLTEIFREQVQMQRELAEFKAAEFKNKLQASMADSGSQEKQREENLALHQEIAGLKESLALAQVELRERSVAVAAVEAEAPSDSKLIEAQAALAAAESSLESSAARVQELEAQGVELREALEASRLLMAEGQEERERAGTEIAALQSSLVASEAVQTEQRSENDRLSEMIEAYQKEIAGLNEEVAGLSKEIAELKGAFALSEEAAGARESELQELRGTLDSTRAQLSDTESMLNDFRAGQQVRPDVEAKEVATLLYGAISSFNADLRGLRDAVAMVKSDNADEREDGLDVLGYTLEGVQSRAAELKTLGVRLNKIFKS